MCLVANYAVDNSVQISSKLFVGNKISLPGRTLTNIVMMTLS